MRKHLILMVFAFSALMMLNGCVVSEMKLTDKIQEVIVAEEKDNGNTLEITEFNLGDKTGKDYKGVLKGVLNGKPVEYDVTVNDEGNDFDVDWTLKK